MVVLLQECPESVVGISETKWFGNALYDVDGHRRGSFGISGIVSVENHYSKSLQFFLVNGRLVKKTALHACVNSALSNSLICRTMSRRCESSKWPAPLEGGRDTVSPRRTLDKYGVYVLKLECPRTEYDICLEPAKTLVEFKA